MCQVERQIPGNEEKGHETVLFPANHRQCVGQQVAYGNELEKDTKRVQREGFILKFQVKSVQIAIIWALVSGLYGFWNMR